ncbi:MAG: alpha/beta fold hydrolase [Chloroflexi bacterium]|nr:alpha/beta fold hydrolase [Chloroflexota bacterium]
MSKDLINGIGLYHEEHGSGFPLLLATGFSGTTRMWSSQVPALSKNHRLIIYDFRGHGQTDAPRDLSRYSMDMMVEDQRQLLRHLGIREAVVGGLSLGGLVAMWLAVRHSELVRALVVADTGPGFRNPETRAKWDQERLKASHLLETGGMEAFMGSEHAKLDYYTTPEVMRTLDPIGISNVNRGVLCNLQMVPLEQIRVPTLVLVGELDKDFVPASEYIHKRIPGSRLVVIPRAGHGANVDNPEAFNQAVLSFLRELGL